MQLIYLSPVPWSSFAQRPHKFVEWYHAANGDEVIWVDPYPTRFPQPADIGRMTIATKAEAHQIPAWLKVFRPKALPIEPLPGSGLLNGMLWRALLQEICIFARRKTTLLAIAKPSVLAIMILKRLPGMLSLYDAMDDFPAFYAALSRRAMQWRERQIVGKVTHLMTSSTVLQRQWAAVRSDAQLVPNGLDAGVLPPSKGCRAVPSEHVFGYVGTIGSWFDWDWVIALAYARPRDIVRLIGPVYVPATGRKLPANIELLPGCGHDAALRAMQDFSVGLIPFKKNEITRSVDPIKFYEYRALGLPVISSDFGEMAFRDTEDGIFLSRSGDDINKRVDEALLYRADGETTRQFIRKNTWEVRFANAKFF